MKAYYVKATIEPLSVKELVGDAKTVLIQTNGNPSSVFIGDAKEQPFEMKPNTAREFPANIYLKGDGIGMVAILA